MVMEKSIVQHRLFKLHKTYFRNATYDLLANDSDMKAFLRPGKTRELGVLGPELGVLGPELGVLGPELGVLGPELGVFEPELGSLSLS